MIREHFVEQAQSRPLAPTAFRWRGDDVSRLEGFADAVFGFALTLLVVSLEVPRTFDALMATMRGFVGFAVCFCLLTQVWHDHYLFFRRYGLRDSATLTLNLTLLFVVMFYVYPLKFLFTLLASVTTGAQAGAPVIRSAQVPALMIVYGLGFMAVHGVFALMYANAWRQRDELELNQFEPHDTRAYIGNHLMFVGIGLLSVLIALIGGPRFVAVSGMSYFSIGVGMGVFWSAAGARRRQLEAAFEMESRSAVVAGDVSGVDTGLETPRCDTDAAIAVSTLESGDAESE